MKEAENFAFLLARKDQRIAELEAVVQEAASVVWRAGRRPDGTAWADLNINDLAAKVADLSVPVKEKG